MRESELERGMMAWRAPWWKKHPLKWKRCCLISLLIQLENDVIWKSWRPLILEENLRLSPFTSLEFCLQNTELTVVTNHKKMDKGDEEKEERHLEAPFLGSSFFNVSFWQPNNTSCLREAFLVYNLRSINRWLLLTNTHTHSHTHTSFSLFRHQQKYCR